MEIKMSVSKLLVIILSLITVISVTGSAYSYFDRLEKSKNESITIGEWDTGIAISTAQEFYDLATSTLTAHGDLYYLTNDIDFSGFTWDYNSSYNDNIFKGVIDGKGYTLQNITITSTDTSSVGLSIFSKIDGATIKNLNIDNFKMGFSLSYFNATALESSIFASQVIGPSNIIENITISNAEVIGNSLDGAGGLVTSVNSDADLIVRNIKVSDITVLNTSKRAGGIICRVFAGTGVVVIEDVELQGYIASDNRTSNTGGILGTAQDANITISRVVVEYIAEGTVTLSDGIKTIKSDRYAGGIVGNNNSQTISINDAFFTGTLYNNTKYMGAIVGRDKIASTINNSYYSAVTFTSTTTAPINTTGVHGQVVNVNTMPSLAWWNSFATTYYNTNSLWTQDVNGRLKLIR